jgi:nicotinamide-nucleotide amidase
VTELAAAGPDAAAEIIARLTARGQTAAVAESLTGGLLAAALTAVPGASAAFRGGVVAYATEVKATMLGVPRDLLERHGAVHPDVAVAMAAGVRRRMAATIGAATTGAADGQPVGTVYIAVSAGGGPAGDGGRGDATVRSLALSGSRDEIRRQTVAECLRLILGRIGEENT